MKSPAEILMSDPNHSCGQALVAYLYDHWIQKMGRIEGELDSESKFRIHGEDASQGGLAVSAKKGEEDKAFQGSVRN